MQFIKIGTPVNIGGTPVLHSTQASASAAVVMQLYTNVILETPIIKLPAEVDTDSKSTVVEDLPKHQKLAQKNATYYLKTINPLISNSVASIIGFTGLWNAEYGRLLTLAAAIDKGGNKTTFEEGIKNLISKTKEEENLTKPVITELNKFLTLVTTDASNFATDENFVEIAMAGQSGMIAQLKKNIESANSAMEKDNAMIAGGAVGEVVGILMIVVGILAEIETFGATTALIAGGIVVVGGSTAIIAIGGKDLEKQMANLKKDTATLTQDEQVYALTKQGSEAIKQLKAACQNAVTAVEGLQKTWSSLGADLEQVVQQLQSVNPDMPSWLVDTLHAANNDWIAAYNLAVHMQQNDVIKVTSGKVPDNGDISKIVKAS